MCYYEYMKKSPNKKQQDKNELVTKRYLDGALKRKINESESRLNKRIDRVMKYIDFKLEPIEKFITEFQDFKNKVFEKFDWLMRKYTKLDDENAASFEQYKRVDEKLANHKNRISVLEKKTSYKTS